jgi:hypothetical protein
MVVGKKKEADWEKSGFPDSARASKASANELKSHGHSIWS